MQQQHPITAAGPADFPELVEVWEASVRATHDFLREEDFQHIKSVLASDFLPAVRLYLVRGEGGRVLGFLGASDEMVEMLFIHPGSRGSGVGKRLLRFAVGELGLTRVDVNEQNEQALGFYRHMGFLPTGRSPLDGMGKPYPLVHLALPS